MLSGSEACLARVTWRSEEVREWIHHIFHIYYQKAWTEVLGYMAVKPAMQESHGEVKR